MYNYKYYIYEIIDSGPRKKYFMRRYCYDYFNACYYFSNKIGSEIMIRELNEYNLIYNNNIYHGLFLRYTVDQVEYIEIQDPPS